MSPYDDHFMHIIQGSHIAYRADCRGRGQAELDWRNVDTVLLWGINVQASLKVVFGLRIIFLQYLFIWNKPFLFLVHQYFLADDSGASEAPEPCQQHNHTSTSSRFSYFPFSVFKIFLERFSGLQVSDSARLEVRDNTFLNVESASLDIVNVDHVEVVGNAFSQNAIKVIIIGSESKLI